MIFPHQCLGWDMFYMADIKKEEIIIYNKYNKIGW